MKSTSTPKLLVGARAIAHHLEIKEAQVYHFTRSHSLPVFRIGKSLCARPSSLEKWIAQQARAQS